MSSASTFMPRSNRSPPTSVHARLRLDRPAGSLVPLPQRRGCNRAAAAGTRRISRPSGRRKTKSAARVGHRVAALVQQAVVVPAELDEVVQARRAAVRPVLDVVRVDGACVGAAREAAAAVADCAARGAAPAGSLRVLRPTLSGLPARSISGTIAASHASRRAVSAAIGAPSASSAPAVAPSRERGGVDVDDDLVAIAAARAAGAAGQQRVGHQHERVGAPLGKRGRFRGSVAGRPRFRGSALEVGRSLAALPRKRPRRRRRFRGSAQPRRRPPAAPPARPRPPPPATARAARASRRRRGPSVTQRSGPPPAAAARPRDHAAVRAHEPLELRRRRVARQRRAAPPRARPPPRA